jgi:hypothetical protein
MCSQAAKKTADKSKSILNNIERWQKVCDLEFCYLVTQFDLFFVYNADSHFCLFVPGSRKHWWYAYNSISRIHICHRVIVDNTYDFF